MPRISRRGFIGGVAAGAAGLAGANLVGSGTGTLLGKRAFAASSERTAVLTIFFTGQYPAMFSATDAIVGAYGVTSADVEMLGNGLAIDRSTLGTLPAFAKSRMATIGAYHGITGHAEGISRMMGDGKSLYLTQLAAAIGGSGAIQSVYLGADAVRWSRTRPVDGVSPQSITDLAPFFEMIGKPIVPEKNGLSRPIAASILARSQAMSKAQTTANPYSLRTLAESYKPVVGALTQTPPSISFADLDQAYGLGGKTFLNTYPGKMAAAELAIRAGANTAFVEAPVADGMAWDSHGNYGKGDWERALMRNHTIGPLRTFCTRMMDQQLNLVVALIGEFSHSANRGHNPCLSATVIGKYVKQGTTGRPPANNAVLPQGTTPGVDALWSYIAAVCKVSTNPFGANPHPLVLS